MCLVVYNANAVTLWSGDTLPARYLPLMLLRYHTLTLDRAPTLYDDRAPGKRIGGVPYYVPHVRGHYVSWFPIATPLLALPVYAAAAMAITLDDASLVQVEKAAASLLVSASVALLYLALRHATAPGYAFTLALVYAFGTSSFSVSSQALWQHTGAQLALAAGLHALLAGRRNPRWAAWAGVPLAVAVTARPSNVLLVAPLAAYVLLVHRASVRRFFLGAALVAVAQMWYSATYFGNPAWTYAMDVTDHWTTDAPAILGGLAGLLVSPGRGLLVYSPIFLLAPIGITSGWRRGGDLLVRALSVGVALTVLTYASWTVWWGGHTFGPRLLADLTPALTVCLVPLADRLAGPRWRLAFAALAIWSVAAHAVGAFSGLEWNSYFDVRAHPERLWWWAESPLAYGVRQIIRGWTGS